MEALPEEMVDAWAIKDTEQGWKFCLRVNDENVMKTLALSGRSGLWLNSPAGLNPSPGLVWLKKPAGESGYRNVTLEEALAIALQSPNHMGLVQRQMSFALRVAETDVKPTRQALGLEVLDGWRCTGLPPAATSNDVISIMKSIGWEVSVDDSARRCNKGSSSYVIWAPGAPPRWRFPVTFDGQRCVVALEPLGQRRQRTPVGSTSQGGSGHMV